MSHNKKILLCTITVKISPKITRKLWCLINDKLVSGLTSSPWLYVSCCSSLTEKDNVRFKVWCEICWRFTGSKMEPDINPLAESSLPPRLPARAPLMSWMKNRDGRPPPRLPLHQSLLTWFWQPLSDSSQTGFFPSSSSSSSSSFPPALQFTGTAARAVEGSACKAAALSPAARSPASPPIAVRWPGGRPAGRVLGVACRGWGCGSAPAGVRAAGGCCPDSWGRRQEGKRGNGAGGWPAWGRNEPGTLLKVLVPQSRCASAAPEAAPSPASPRGLGSPPPSWFCPAGVWLGRPPASSPPAPGGYDTSSWSTGRSPGSRPGWRSPPWTSPAAPVKQHRQNKPASAEKDNTQREVRPRGSRSNKLHQG